MAGRNRWTTGNPEVSSGSGPVEPETDIHCCSWLKQKKKPSGQSIITVPVDPGPDDCCCSWLKRKPKSKTEDTNREGKGKEYSNEIDPIDRAMKLKPSDQSIITDQPPRVDQLKPKSKPFDKENSDGIPGNMKPSPQNQKFGSPGQDNKHEEIKKNGKNTGPNSTNITKSKDGVYSSEEKQMSNIIPKEEDKDGNYGGTRPDSTKNIGNHGGTRSDPTKNSTFEQAGPWKDHIKNRQDDTLEDHHKAVHKPEYNHGIHRDKGNHGGTRSDATKSSTFENDSIKNRHEGILEDHHKAVHKPEYNHGIHRDTGPDLTKKESSSPEQAAGVQKRERKQKETKGNKRHQQ